MTKDDYLRSFTHGTDRLAIDFPCLFPLDQTIARRRTGPSASTAFAWTPSATATTVSAAAIAKCQVSITRERVSAG